MGICTLYHGKILEVGHFCSYWLVLDRRRISLVAILLSPVNEAWYNRWSLDILLASNLCQLLHVHSTPDLSTLKCWNSKKSCAGVCRESAKYIQDLPFHRLLSLPSCRENSFIPLLSLSSLENFFFCRKLYPTGQELFPSMWKQKRSISIWMLHLFFKMYFLSLKHECSTVPMYPLLNKYKEYRLADVTRACRCFLH